MAVKKLLDLIAPLCLEFMLHFLFLLSTYFWVIQEKTWTFTVAYNSDFW